MDKDTSKTMMQSAEKVLLSNLNECITCKLCRGYFIDATTIIECLHTFCRSCIVRYLEKNKYCPICDVQVHKTKPLLNIKPDKTLQDLVYKLVPRLYQNEVQRKKSFYEAHPEKKPTHAELELAAQYDFILTPEESIDLTLSYQGSNGTPRYLRCPCAVSVAHLKRLIGAKYELKEHHRIDLFYNQDYLNPSWSLMDIAYIFSWKRKQSMDITYKIYECKPKKQKLDQKEKSDNPTNNNNNNWKEVQLRISETGEMSITGIQDASILELLDATENFKNEVIVNEGKHVENEAKKEPKKELPGLKFIGKAPVSSSSAKSSNATTKPVTSAPKTSTSDPKKLELIMTPKVTQSAAHPLPRTVELSATLNLNSELTVIPLSTTTGCVSLSSCSTTTVFSTINKSMCSTKTQDSENVVRQTVKAKESVEAKTDSQTPNNTDQEAKTLKRKIDDESKSEVPAKLPKPTILNHSISLMNLSNNHPLKKHKMNRNGEHLLKPQEIPVSTQTVTVNHVSVSQKQEATPSKPIIINKNVSSFQSTRPGTPKLANKPCYLPKTTFVANSKSAEKNGELDKNDPSFSSLSKPPVTHHLPSYQNSLHTSIITPSQLPHNQNHLKPSNSTTNNNTPPPSTQETNHSQLSPSSAPIRTKPSTPIGYKTLRDPPKSWNSQINSQIARVNQNVKTQQLAAQQGGAGADGRSPADLKNVRPAKFFKGRNMPRYLGNPASGVKPMYQVHVSPDKDKNQAEHGSKTEIKGSTEIKKHSIVKIDPKTLKPISEKAPDTSNLSNISTSLSLAASQSTQDIKLNTDLKINTSSVSIFNPLKLQSSPKNERKSPKSPHSPKIKGSSNTNTSGINTITTSSSPTPSNTLSPKQQRDKASLNFIPTNPYVPNLNSPTLNPGAFLFPHYDPRIMAAYQNLLYTQRMAAAAAAGFVPSPLPQPFNLNAIGQQLSPRLRQVAAPPKTNAPAQSQQRMSPSCAPTAKSTSTPPPARKSKENSSRNEKSLETALEKLTQNKAKELESKKEETQTKKEEKPSENKVAEVATPVKENLSSNESDKTSSIKDLGREKAENETQPSPSNEDANKTPEKQSDTSNTQEGNRISEDVRTTAPSEESPPDSEADQKLDSKENPSQNGPEQVSNAVSDPPKVTPSEPAVENHCDNELKSSADAISDIKASDSDEKGTKTSDVATVANSEDKTSEENVKEPVKEKV